MFWITMHVLFMAFAKLKKKSFPKRLKENKEKAKFSIKWIYKPYLLNYARGDENLEMEVFGLQSFHLSQLSASLPSMCRLRENRLYPG